MARFRLKTIARERGLTVDDVARLAGLRFTTVRRIYANKTTDPSYSTLASIARALDVTIEDLIEQDDSPTADKRLDALRERLKSVELVAA